MDAPHCRICDSSHPIGGRHKWGKGDISAIPAEPSPEPLGAPWADTATIMQSTMQTVEIAASDAPKRPRKPMTEAEKSAYNARMAAYQSDIRAAEKAAISTQEYRAQKYDKPHLRNNPYGRGIPKAKKVSA